MLTWEEEVLPLSSVPLQGNISPPPAVASPSPAIRVLDDGAVVSAPHSRLLLRLLKRQTIGG